MDKFPQDILNLILEFDGRIKYRKGEYINCISKNDYRYNILSKLKIPTPAKYTGTTCAMFWSTRLAFSASTLRSLAF